MKKSLFILPLLVLACFCYEAQGQQLSNNFKLEFGNITYARTYEMPGKTQEEIAQAIRSYLPDVSGLGDIVYNGKVFYGEVTNMMIDYQKYGGKWLTILPTLNVPFRSNITIEPKNGSYEVVLSKIEFRTDGRVQYEDVNKSFTEQEGTTFSSVPRVTKAMYYMDQHFKDIFLVTNKIQRR